MPVKLLLAAASVVIAFAAAGADLGGERPLAVERCLSSGTRSLELKSGDQAELGKLRAVAASPVPRHVRETLARLLRVARLPRGAVITLVAVEGGGRAAVSSSGTLVLSRQLWSGERPLLDGEELAAVLAHELAHLEESDMKHRLCEAVAAARDEDLPLAAATGAALRAIWAGDHQLAIAMMQRNHLRELRADRRGAEMLAMIGVPRDAMARMLLKVTSAGEGDYSGSHPAIEARLENLGLPAAQLRALR